jgi:hypothetical protein
MNFKNLHIKTLAIVEHKTLISSGIIALGILFIGIAVIQKEQADNDARTLTAGHPAVETVNDIDTDHDGLPDWREKLYFGSNINNPDTDDDGTNDGDEVRAGRNPIVKNTAAIGQTPNDKLPLLGETHYAASSTDTLGLKKDFFAQYLAQGSKNIKETTFRDLIKKVDAKTFAPNREIINLNVSSENDVSGIKTYANAFGVVIQKYSIRQTDQNEDVVIKNAMTKRDANTRAELQLFAIVYKNFAKDLLAIPVPSLLAKAHLLIVNGYEGMSTGLYAIGSMQTDPINGTAGYEAYMKYRLDVIDGYAMIVAYIADHRITFDATEPGYPFYWNTVAKKTQITK